MKIKLHIPWLMDQFYADTAIKVVEMLEWCGCQIQYPETQTGTGRFAFEAGYWEDARKLGLKFLEEFYGDHYVVCPSLAEVEYIKGSMGKLFNQSIQKGRYKKILAQIVEFSDFLSRVMQMHHFNAELHGIGSIHYSCHASQHHHEYPALENLLQQVEGLELRPSIAAHTNCGFGGMFSMKYPELSARIAKSNIEDLLSEGPCDYLISSDISCVLQLNSYINKHQMPIRALHIADVLGRS